MRSVGKWSNCVDAITMPWWYWPWRRVTTIQRLSVQAGESDFSVACIAATVCDTNGACQITVSIVVPFSKLEQTTPDLRQLVQLSAENIETRLGWRKP